MIPTLPMCKLLCYYIITNYRARAGIFESENGSLNNFSSFKSDYSPKWKYLYYYLFPEGE